MANGTGKAKTVKIRIAVAVDQDGTWGACGWKGAKDSEVMELARENAETSGDGLYRAEQHYYVSVEIPLPRPVEVTGDMVVVETGERVEPEGEGAA